jgi:NADH:ubiquinone oxidoreductase subunit E
MNILEVELCMGSSCFARGNAQALEHIEAYLESNKLTDQVKLSGHLCLSTCSEGPNIRIGGVLHKHVRPETVVILIEAALQGKEPCYG